MLQQIYDVASLRLAVRKCKAKGKKVSLVPTMGALHAGHLSLIELAQQKADKVIVSIYVNPTQFGENEDLDLYPRPLEEDLAKLESLEVEMAYLPTTQVMYPEGFATTVSVDRGLTDRLCGTHRPGHFDAVSTVVSKLLIQSQADSAVFGEKDFQQLQIIKRVVEDLNIPVEIISAPIVREQDGLAMSSRNRYLNKHQREIAGQLNKILNTLTQSLKKAGDFTALTDKGKEQLIKSGFDSVDYIEIVDVRDLKPLNQPVPSARLLAAATIGNTRLIDNFPVEFDS